MASYQVRGRDPLLDANTALQLEKRGRELMGIGLIAVGLLLGLALGSFNPNDPSFFAATDAPVRNWLGGLGANISAFGFVLTGLGAWAIVMAFLTWGGRMVMHRLGARVFYSLIFAPVWVFLCSAYAAGMNQSPNWSEITGMGGLAGDALLGFMINVLPFSAEVGLKLSQLLLGAAILTLGAFVLGFSRAELRWLGRFLMLGVVAIYAGILFLLGRGATGTAGAAQRMHAAHAERRATRSEREQALEHTHHDADTEALVESAPMAVPAAPRVMRAEGALPPLEPTPDVPDMVEPVEEPVQKQGLLARMPSLIRRNDPQELPQPELVEELVEIDMDAPAQDRINAKIANAVKSRRRAAPVAARPVEDPAKPLTKGRGHGPQPLIFNATRRAGDLPAEPPLTAAQVIPAEPPLTAGPKPAARVVAPIPEAPVAPDMGHEAPLNEHAAEEMTQAHYTELRDFDDYGDVPGADPVEMAPLQPEPIAPELVQPEPIQPGAMPAVVPMPEPRKVVQPQTRKPVVPSKRAQAEAQPSLGFDEAAGDYELPPLGLLMSPNQIERHILSDEALEENARMLETVLDDYGIKGEIVSVRPGPVVTMYELEPAPGLKASRVIGLADDIARSMSALSARVSTVPGRSVIGIELPNEKREMVSFREILSGRDYGDGNHKLPLVLGKDIGGDPVVANLAKMPHLLIAGTTGSGKSVAINTMILSLLYKLTPEDLRLVMIDPKMLELSVYDGIPHLLSPVVTDPKKAVVALKWVVGEMEDRYRKMSKMGVRNIDGYNGRVEDALSKNEMFSRTVQTGFDDETGEPVFETEEFEPKKMPYIVVIVDEMADLMMVAGKEIEACIQRLAQMARASGIHLVMATQRPSVDVITGTIKANFPTRISFQVTSKIDSRTILGEMGAEQLLGMGDMLYMAGGSKITRCHGPFVSDEEVEEIVNHLKAFGPPEYVNGVVSGPDEEKADNIDAVLGLNTGGNTGGEDALYDQAVGIVAKDRKCSTSYIQRKLGIGYNKAARLVEQMEDEGVVSAANHVGKREILLPEQ
ncbi:MAG: DNA translocase FtsK 4TM domain-containing protein [Pelagimonas sp.]|jgi:S-DNA-T family DNA segregation ATPase FtsK/SpoIIIE|nr:DNA translocase FtsK 4TM domain-containing protein [Pelagimonas sp.]